jgi:DNA-binding NarL/FixJ family response regulator
MSVRLVISCCNLLFGEGLKSLLEDEREIEIVGIFYGINPPEEQKEMLKLNPDVILAEFHTNSSLILNSSEYLVGNQLRILLIGDRSTSNFADRQLKDLVSRGVVGILPPSADSDLLKKALKAITMGELWLDRATLLKLLTMMKNQGKNVILGKREKEIVFHICQGYRNKEIAHKLNISEQTVKSHCNRIYRKLGVSDRLQLALYSYKMWPEVSKENDN